MVQYYNLAEAAAKLHLTPEQLKEMAKRNEVRAFQDRGNLRFRAPEIDELARSLGHGSDPELQFSDPKAGDPKSAGPKSSGPKTPRGTRHVSPPTDEGFDLGADNEEVPLGQEPSSAAGKNTPRNTNTRSPNPKRAGLAPASPSPRPKPGSDSDVRLIGDGSDLAFQIDSEVKVEKSPSPGPKTPGSRKSKIDAAPDSGVRIVPLDEASDSDVKIVPDDREDSQVPLGQTKSKTPSDSDIRLEELHTDSGKGKRDEKTFVTEEIDLDAEEMKAARDAATHRKPKPKPREGSSAQLPTTSPFELSEPDVQLDPKPRRQTSARRPSKVKPEQKKTDDEKDSSSDFELTPLGDSSSPIELGSDEMTPIKLDDSDEEVGLGELTGPGAGRSGINLKDPVDSGISLEQGGSDEMELEVNLAGGSTPKPKPKSQVDSSSEFELSLDDSDGETEEGSSSEFELTLDEPSSPTDEGTSSEFELSLDLEGSSGELASPAADSGSDSEFELTIDDAALQEEDKDIFETDFEVPALDEESGSEAVALDEEGAELDANSDFDLDVDEDVDTEAESGSEVVPLDDAEGGGAKKKKGGGRTMIAEDEEQLEPSDFEELDEAETEPAADSEEEEEVLEEEDVAPVRRSWGIVTPVAATLCTVVMFFVCLMSYEMIHGMMGYHKSTKTSSLIVDPLARMLFDDNSGSFPKD